MSATLHVVLRVDDMTPDALREEMYNRIAKAFREDIEDALWLHLNPVTDGRRHEPFIDVNLEHWAVDEGASDASYAAGQRWMREGGVPPSVKTR